VEPGSFGEFQLSYRTGDIVSPHLDAREPLAVEAEHFVDCVRTGSRPKTDGASGLRVVRALEEAERWMRYRCDGESEPGETDGGHGLLVDRPIWAIGSRHGSPAHR